MALRSLLFVCTIIAYGNAQCYDRYTRRSYRVGQTFARTKPLGNLKGTYGCTCMEGGRMYCKATDIPCRDFVTRQYADKEERFNVLWRGLPYNCICRGGFGRFDTCNPGHLQAGRCRGVDGREVMNGGNFIIEKYGSGMSCRCQNGKAVASTCRKVCLDFQTKQVVETGQDFTYSSFGNLHTCTCVSGSPRACQLQQAVLDPCIFGQDDCDRPRATCSSQGSRYTCACKAGYDGDGRNCNDINECFGDHGCDLNAVCTNTEGSYTCTCDEGYSGNGRICIAQNLNSCDSNAVFCDVNARCEPSEESFVCICSEGYTGNGFNCQDHDECTGDHGCDSNASCNNTIGSYLCFCNYGYSGDGISCTQMCRDETTGMYVPKQEVFTKIEDSRQLTCTCGENGKEVESSCFGGEEEELPAGCLDQVSGELVKSGGSFTMRIRNVENICTCDDGEALSGSCRTKPSENGPVCRRRGRTYSQGESYVLSARGRTYTCTCLQRRGSPISRCRIS